MIYLKSVQKPPSTIDGIRICIMRRPDPWIVFDIWIPRLSPSEKLLDSYHEEKVTWKEFETLFTKEVLHKKNKFLQLLIDLGKKEDITLLCWEKTPEKCHRRLVAEYLQKMDNKVVIKSR